MFSSFNQKSGRAKFSFSTDKLQFECREYSSISDILKTSSKKVIF